MRSVLGRSGYRRRRRTWVLAAMLVCCLAWEASARGTPFVYVANSQWEKYTDDGKRKPEVKLTAPVLLSLPLRDR